MVVVVVVVVVVIDLVTSALDGKMYGLRLHASVCHA